MPPRSQSSPPQATRNANAHKLLEAWWTFGQIMRQQIIPSVVGKHGLEFRDFLTLTSINEGDHFPKMICKRLVTTPSDVSRILDKLEESGFVKRELDTEDSRRIKASLTKAGVQVLEDARENVEHVMVTASGTLGDDELEHFTDTMMLIATGAREMFKDNVDKNGFFIISKSSLEPARVEGK
jgi:DNA-binding MarR family transcriptional regulator